MARDVNLLEMSTLVTTVESAKGLAELPTGELVIATKCAVWLLETGKALERYAGEPTQPAMVFGERLQARFKELGAVRYLEYAGYEGLFIVDRDSCIVSFVCGDMVEPFVGEPGRKGKEDGPRQKATLNFPTDVAVFRDRLFITDYSNDLVRMVSPSGYVTSIGGGKTSIGSVPFESAEFKNPFGLLATDDAIYVSEHIRSRIRKIELEESTVTLVTGTTQDSFQDGPPSIALWNMVRGLCSDSLGNIYAADCRNDLIRMVSDTEVKTVIGRMGEAQSTNGPLSTATTQRPFFLLITSQGDLVWSEEYTKMVRTVVGFSPPKLIVSPCLEPPPLSSSSPLSSTFPSVRIQTSPYHLSIIPPLIQLSLPQLTDIQAFIDGCPTELHPSLPAFFGLLHRSFDLMQTSKSSENAITIAHVLQLLARAGMDTQNTILGQHLYFRFFKAIRFRPLASLLPLISSCHCLAFDPLLNILLLRLKEFPVPEIEAISSDFSSLALPSNLLELVGGASASFTCKLPHESPFAELDASLLALSQSTPSACSFVLKIADPINESVSISDWLLAAQWPWFRALLESGLAETSSRCLELPANFPTALLSVIITHLHFGKIETPIHDLDEILTFIDENGGQFGFVDLEGQSMAPFQPMILKLRSIQYGIQQTQEDLLAAQTDATSLTTLFSSSNSLTPP
jgi:hypothetical protein